MNGRLQTAFGFFLLLLIAAFSWFVLTYLLRALTDLDRTIITAVIAAAVAVFSLIFGFFKEKSKARSEAHREKKVEIYGIFFDLIFEMINKSKSGIDEEFINSEYIQGKFSDLMKGVMFYGSPGVIRAISDWRIYSAGNGSDSIKTMKTIGKVLLEMRKDIGLSNFGIDSLSIHQTYVSDKISDLTSKKAST